MNLFAAGTEPVIDGLGAITLSTRDMRSAVRFYQALGFPLLHGGENEPFTSFAAGASYLNLTVETHDPINGWGRVVIYASDVDAMSARRSQPGSLRRPRRAMRLGTNAISMSGTPTGTN
jgi:catechol 2,3-dioxygenase-like lactoylglutathione lyase family enzyme